MPARLEPRIHRTDIEAWLQGLDPERSVPAFRDNDIDCQVLPFGDLFGSTLLSTRFDPEHLREIVGAYHRCAEPVQTCANDESCRPGECFCGALRHSVQ